MPGESKGCGCCCASRICFMVYCGIFALLSLIGIVNFVIPSANTCCSGLTFFLTGEAPSVEAAAYRYCNEFAIENGSSPTAGRRSISARNQRCLGDRGENLLRFVSR